MRFLKFAFVAAVFFAVSGMSTEAPAGPRVSFGYYSPGFSIYVGPRPYYYHHHHHYYYRPYYYRRHYYYRPYRPYYRPSYRGSGRCGYWSRRCARNWGYRNRNYYGCMRHHGCR